MPLWRIGHPLVVHMQRVPGEVRSGGSEPVRALSDRIWWKVKTSGLRGVVTELAAGELSELKVHARDAWWGGAAGVRKEDSAGDFYRQIESEARRQGRGTGKPGTRHLLPRQVDVDRLAAENADRAVEALREVVTGLVARSLLDGKPYAAALGGHVVTALVRADEGGEAYLAIAADGFVHPQMIGLILGAVPGIPSSEWQPEPGGVAGIDPREGQIIWSTLIPPGAQARILELGGAG